MENSNYSTEIIGSLSSVMDSTSIILYNKNNFSGRISIYNINEFYSSILKIGNYQELIRESPQENYTYIPGKLVEGFNVIIFIDPSTNSPSGYCDFVNTQGKGVSLQISLNYTGHSSEDTYGLIEISNSVLVTLESVVTGKSIVGDSPYEYTGGEKVITKKKENLYTDNATRLATDPASVISLGFGVAYKNKFSPLNLTKNTLITPYPEYYRDLDSYTVTYYMNDIVAYGWSSVNDLYSIVSLSRKNRYGSSIYYTPIDVELMNVKQIPKYGDETEVDVKYIAGKYIYTKTGHIYDVYLEQYVEDGERFFTDPYDPDSKIWNLPEFKTKDEAILEFPDLSWTYLNLSEFFRSYKGIIVKKIGNWIIFKQGDSEIYVASSPVMVIYMTRKEVEDAFFINDQTVLLPGIDNTYYTLYNTPFITYYTERARVINENGYLINYYDYWLDPTTGNFEPLEYKDENYLGICSSLDTSKNIEYNNYYQEEKIKVIRKNHELYTTHLNGYRHSAYMLEGQGVPDFCCSFGGLLFWTSNYKINYI